MVVPLFLSLQKYIYVQHMEKHKGLRLNLKASFLCETHLKYYSGLLKQIRSHVGTDDVISPIKANLNVFPKAAAVVIAGGFCISNCLHRREEKECYLWLNHSLFGII